MGELRVRSVLVTGANRGIGLGFVWHLLGLPNPPEWVFAACRDPKGQRAQVRLVAVGDSRAGQRPVQEQPRGARQGCVRVSITGLQPWAQSQGTESRGRTAMG